jgi:hypothetical protein
MSEPHRQVVDFLRKTFPSVRLDVNEFSSGAAMIDVRFRGRFVVVEYLPSMGFGVSEPSQSDPSFGGHDHTFATAREVNAYLTDLLGREFP